MVSFSPKAAVQYVELSSCFGNPSQESCGTLMGLKSGVQVGGQMGVGEGSSSQSGKVYGRCALFAAIRYYKNKIEPTLLHVV